MKPKMMKQISNEVVKNHSYEDDFRAIYESDEDITVDEEEKLMNERFFYFPVTKSSYALDGNTMTIDYTVDKCN